jgi:hypothetical protein
VILLAAAVVLCMSAEEREAARTIMLDGVDAALKQQIINLSENLLKDRGDQPDRMSRGVRNSVALYLRSRSSLKTWSPPTCKE